MNDKKYIDDDICMTQGEIYEYAAKLLYDREEFSQKYLTSNFCNREMDARYSVFQLADAEECMDFIQKEFVPQTSPVQYIQQKTFWIGYTYRRLQMITGIPSRELANLVPYPVMARYYEGLHTVDEDVAIEIIIEDMEAKFGKTGKTKEIPLEKRTLEVK